MSIELGLRERKKQRTRQLISETAGRLFAARGFDSVVVAEVARAAEVSEVTVFNYFPTKEDLFFDGLEFFEEKLLEEVRDRPVGESVLAAFRRPVVDGCSRLASEMNTEPIARAATIINSSSALQARERGIVAYYTQQLAMLVADETRARPDDVEVVAVATALMSVHRSLVAYVRTSVLEGRRGTKLGRDARSQAVRAFARLESGLADYAIRTAERVRHA